MAIPTWDAPDAAADRDEQDCRGALGEVMGTPQTLIVRAGKSSSRHDVMEELLVTPEADAWRLLRSPGLVLGTAADDIITVDDARDVRVLRRGGNVAVQLFFTSDGRDVKAAALAAFADIEARLDGESDWQVVFTIPFAVGFEAIEKRLAVVMASCPGADWMYGNVYDENQQPLSWWAASAQKP